MSSEPPDPFGTSGSPPSAAFGSPAGASAAPTGGQSGFAIAALVLGVIGLLTTWCLVGVVPAILGIVFGVLGRNETAGPFPEKTGRGMATAGLVCGIVGIALLAVLIIIGAAVGDD